MAQVEKARELGLQAIDADANSPVGDPTLILLGKVGHAAVALADAYLAQQRVIEAADALRERVAELDGKARDFGRLNEAAAYDDARAALSANPPETKGTDA